MADLIDAYSRTEEGKGVVQKIEEQVNAMKTRGDVIQAVACPRKMKKAAKRQRDWENRVRRERTDVGSANQATGDDIAAGAVDEEYAGCLRVTLYVLGYVETTKSWYEKAEPGRVLRGSRLEEGRGHQSLEICESASPAKRPTTYFRGCNMKIR